MIAKKIHYCWFGQSPKTPLMQKCINSWHKFCPDYEIIEWNESNIDIRDCKYAQQALENKKWSFLSDYVRFKVIYEYGGIYLDTDVELLKSLDPLLHLRGFLGFEDNEQVNTGVGFGAEINHPAIYEMCEIFRNMNLYFEDGSMNYEIQPILTTKMLLKHGLVQNNTLQEIADLTIYPTDYFAPKNYNSLKAKITKNTYSIHWYTASWQTPQQRKNHNKEVAKDYFVHLPNRFLLSLLGENTYNKIKNMFTKI